MNKTIIAGVILVILTSLFKTSEESVTMPLPSQNPETYTSYLLQFFKPNQNQPTHENLLTRTKRGYIYVPDRPPGTWGSQMLNKFKSRTSNLLSSAGFNHGIKRNHNEYQDNGYHVMDSAAPPDDMESAGAFWNLYRAGGGHGGHGGGGGGYGKSVNKSAVGLLAFLSLLSLIQMSLSTTTTAAAARKKRETETEENGESETDSIMKIVLPLMTSVTAATRNRSVSMKECILFQMCQANERLTKEFGDQGVSLGSTISAALGKMLKESGKLELLNKFKYAGMAGRNGKACNKLYKSCHEVSQS